MNILIITPFYRIEGRPDLTPDTNAIYYLVKPWAREHNVKVIYVYINGFRKITRYLSKEARKYYSDGYEYQVDGVDVYLIELQRIYKQPLWIDYSQGRRIRRMVNSYLQDKSFSPELVITHIPTETDGMLKGLFPDSKKIAVLHSTDMKVCMRNNRRYDLMRSNHTGFFARSRAIRDWFTQKKLHNVSQELIISGVPKTESVFRNCKKPYEFKIIYAGKFIPRKHIDLAIKALSELKEKYSFSFSLYGKGREEAKLKVLAQELLGDRIVFHEQVSREEMLNVMENADVFIMPSTQETFGLVYIEAMSKGCIPIGVKGEGIDGVIIDGVNGFLVEPNDINSLVNKLITIFEMDQHEYEKLVQNVIHYGSVYNEDDMGHRYLDLIIESTQG